MTVITDENALAGESDSTKWDMPNAYNGDVAHLGFSDKTSYNAGTTATFYIDNTACDTIRVYRIGHYGGDNWRLKATLSNTTGVNQPEANTIASSNGATECSNWTATATWSIPSDAVSGLYVAVVERNSDSTVQFRIPFVVRQDSRQADIVVGIPTSTWGAAYNFYNTPANPAQGAGLYGVAPFTNQASRTYAVSYDRPIITRGNVANHWDLLDSAAIDFLEKNGYDVKYVTSEDLNFRPSSFNDAKAFISVGHDEYWSDDMKANIEAFRDAGGHLIWWTANEIFWRIRYEDERTFWCYKDSLEGGTTGDRIDPVSPYFTGTWRDTRAINPFSGEAENQITGSFFRMTSRNSDPNNASHYDNGTVVTATYGSSPFWRDTTVESPGSDLTLTDGLGGEIDELDIPADGRESTTFATSTVTTGGNYYATDDGVVYNNTNFTWGAGLHRRNQWEGFVFTAGTWAWTQLLSDFHEAPNKKLTAVQQAMVNLFDDLGLEAASLDAGLTAPTRAAMSGYGFTDYTAFAKTASGYTQGYVPWEETATTLQARIPTHYTAAGSPIAISAVADGSDTLTGSSDSTAISGVAPVDGDTYLLAVNVADSGSPQPTVTGVSGWGQTWTELSTQAHAYRRNLAVFYTTVSAGSSGDVTVSFTGAPALQDCSYILVRVQNFDSFGVEIEGASTSNQTSWDLLLPGANDPVIGDAVISFLALEQPQSVSCDWTKFGSDPTSTNSRQLSAAYLVKTDESTLDNEANWTWSTTACFASGYAVRLVGSLGAG